MVGHAYPKSYGHSFKPTASARRRGRRRLLMGQTGSWIRRRQRVQPPSTFCKVAGRSIFEPQPTGTPQTTPVPTPTEIITDLLRAEHVHTTSLLGGLNTWITAPVDEFPDLYPVYVAFVDKLGEEETKGETQYAQLSPGDFRRLSPTRQIAEFRKLGVDAHTDQEVLRILLGPAPPSPEGTYSLPTATVAELPLLDILHHERHLGKHIRRMAERRGEAIRQASRLTRIPGNSSTREKSFCDTISSIQQLTRSLDDQRRLHLLLTNRRKALLKQLRHRPPVTNLHIQLYSRGARTHQLL